MQSRWETANQLLDDLEGSLIPAVRNVERRVQFGREAYRLRQQLSRVLGHAEGTAEASQSVFSELDADVPIIREIDEQILELVFAIARTPPPQGRPKADAANDLVIAHVAYQHQREGLSPTLTAAIKYAIERHKGKGGEIKGASPEAIIHRIRAIVNANDQTWKSSPLPLQKKG